MESKELAAAILTQTVFDHNNILRNRLIGATEEVAANMVIGVYRDCLKHLEKRAAAA